MAKNAALGKAKDAKQDEFYTQLADIENELRHYRPHFKGKTILCNCDDPYESNFFKYFALNFNKLKLKKLIATCYAGSPITGTQLSLFGAAVALASLSVMQSARFPARRPTWPAANSTTLSGSWISPREAATSVAASPLIS